MFAKNYHLHWIAGRANIVSKGVTYIIVNFGCGFYDFCPMAFPKAPAFYCKQKNELIFAALYFFIRELKKCVSDF